MEQIIFSVPSGVKGIEALGQSGWKRCAITAARGWEGVGGLKYPFQTPATVRSCLLYETKNSTT